MPIHAPFLAYLALALPLAHAAAPSEENAAYPPDITAWTMETKRDQQQAAETLVARIKAAIGRGEKQFRIQPGHYRFHRGGLKRFELRDVKDLAIDATGATFWFDGRYRIDSMAIIGCTNVSIKGLTIDYDPLPYAQGHITAFDKKQKRLEIRIEPGYPLPDAAWTKEVGKIKAVFYGQDRRMTEVRMDWIKALDPIGGRTYRVTLKFGWVFQDVYKADIHVGDWLCLPDRSMRMSFMVAGSEAVTLEDITIYACPHMAFAEVGGEGGHVYRRCRVVRRPDTKRLMACNADVFHSNTVRRGPTIEECEFSHSGDDFVNIHGFFFMVHEPRSPTQVVLANQYHSDCYGVGSDLGFYSFKDLRPLGDAKVVAMDPIPGKDTFEACKRMPAELREQGHNIRDFHPRNIYPFLVTLDRPVQVSRYDFVGCSDRSGNGAIIRSNYMHDGFSRGILVKCSNALIEGNRIERDGTGSIAVAAERYWMEGPFARDVTIRNNTIVDPGRMFLSHNWNTTKLGAITVISQGHVGLTKGMHNRNIRIEGNTITRPAACGIAVINARDCLVEGNTIEAPFSKEPIRLGSSLRVKEPFYAIYLAEAEHVQVRGNTVIHPTAYCRGPVGLGPGADRDTIRVDAP